MMTLMTSLRTKSRCCCCCCSSWAKAEAPTAGRPTDSGSRCCCCRCLQLPSNCSQKEKIAKNGTRSRPTLEASEDNNFEAAAVVVDVAHSSVDHKEGMLLTIKAVRDPLVVEAVAEVGVDKC